MSGNAIVTRDGQILASFVHRRPVHKNAPDGLDDCDVGTVTDGSDVTIVQDDFTSVCFQSPRDCKHIATTRVVARCEKTHLRIASQVSVQTPRPSFREGCRLPAMDQFHALAG
ncbi:hypothetical protein PF005_g20837 [Phytophthora fragariae]|uniref:Uncharacterized protein n=1 Tax=Phytophthora fragariae TaxID=53985 RepID=A0A6A3SKP1_9STRA|nr:hypothetical protein PF010_g18916 [Phytophthora fragariae]KAE9119119.1 hypothetical protein PF006_g18425 [Phytophthora fragariae]KAE9186469.1 hypothetical protein PF005_g20837 [Phytophthora fragariae]KAE9199726.1 hypothetical protein PF002_g22063 [Phytophthora fragariae]KAE9202899.1 hypothetical protein PF004_g18287 [Phytophthora fragariae]